MVLCPPYVHLNFLVCPSDIVLKIASGVSSGGFQKKISCIFENNLYDPGNKISLHITVMRRLINLFDPFVLDFDSKIDLNSCIATLNSVSVPDRAMVVKTWLNGWATSYRIKGEHMHQCFLGCSGGNDSLCHYLQCPRIYAACCLLISGTPSDPLERCGLVNPTRNSFLLVASIFSAYHSLKHHILSRYDDGIPINLDFLQYWIFSSSL